MSFFRLLLIFLVAYLLIRFISSFFSPKGRNNASGNGYFSSKQRKEGEVIINTNNQKTEKKIKKEDGDYVDFEEL